LKKNVLCIIPKKSLVQNIGFGEDATFTKNTNSKLAEIKAQEIISPLKHSLKIRLFDSEIEHLIIENIRAN
jgi:hypothetical protein